MSREAICGGWGRDDLADARRLANNERTGGGKVPAKRVPEVPVVDVHENHFGVPTPYGYDPLSGASRLIRGGLRRSLGK